MTHTPHSGSAVTGPSYPSAPGVRAVPGIAEACFTRQTALMSFTVVGSGWAESATWTHTIASCPPHQGSLLAFPRCKQMECVDQNARIRVFRSRVVPAGREIGIPLNERRRAPFLAVTGP